VAFSAKTIGTTTAPVPVAIGSLYQDTYALTGPGDVAMLAVTLIAGQWYNFDADEDNVGGDSGPYDGYLRLFDRFGNEVAAGEDQRTDFNPEGFFVEPNIYYVANYSGTFYVAISNESLRSYDPTTIAGRNPLFDPIEYSLGSLRISNFDGGNEFQDANSISESSNFDIDQVALLTRLTRDDPEFGAGEQRRVALPGIASIATPTDVDIMTISLTSRDVFVIDVNADVVTPFDSYLRIANNLGVQLAVNDDSGGGASSEIIFAPGTAGTFAIGISGFGNNSYSFNNNTGLNNGATGSYDVVFHLNPDVIGFSNGIADSITIGAGSSYVVTLSGNDTVTGGLGFDTLAGGDDSDSLSGGIGEDVLYGEMGNDTLNGGQNSDVLVGGYGNDSLNGGGDNAGDLLQGDAGIDTLDGANGADTLDGGSDNDSLIGGAGNDSLIGGTGNDTLTAGSEADRLEGGAGNDLLLGGTGSDTLVGGADADTLTGGADADVFVFAAAGDGIDTITDFNKLLDDIDLRGVFGAGVVNAGNLATYIQASAAPGGSQLLVDANGAAGGALFTTLAVVNVTPAALFDINNFLL